MMAEGRFASLPRSLHAHHHAMGGVQCFISVFPSCSIPSGQETPAAAYQSVSLHGTLPRRRRGGANVGLSSHAWNPKTNQTQPLLSGNASAPAGLVLQPFSRDQFILDCSLEKLRRELEEELKMSSEEPRSHAWYHGAIPRQVAESLVQRDGDFLLRDSLSSPGSFVLTCQWRNAAQHFKISKKVVILNDAYSRVEYLLDKEGFDSVPALIRFYVGNRKPVSQVVGAIIFQPINRAFPLRYLEEKYGLSSNHKEAGLMVQERRSQNRLSLNITNGHDDLGKTKVKLKDRCGSQPASLNQVQEKRRPLKAHQSESFLPLGQAIRGSDSQLCPKPPPKPSKVPLTRLPLISVVSPPGVVQCPDSELASGRTERLHPRPADLRSCRPPEPDRDRQTSQNPPTSCSYVERLKTGGEAAGQKTLDRSSYHHAIAALESTSEEEEEEEEKARCGFLRPVLETESAFRPAEFESRLLPPENKPLEMAVLKRAKELLLTSCKNRCRMGVSSGLELVTLPHGRQLRLDLMERHHTMAVGVAVDILGCTGTVEERASTLNRIILVAMELKNAVGDLFAFTALMKALDMQQISRLEETWTTLRRNYTQNAVSYEKILKPFYKSLYEGEASSPSVVCIPLLLPLLTLMERPSTTPEGVELWETSDQGCDIMLRHLEAARDVANNAQSYTSNAEKILEGFQFDEDLLEVFKTDFQLRLLWGSRGAAVNQSDRYNKFNLILTALSRKLEPVTKTQLKD
uniref:BCAR3 adaptor protein, NSP family member n=1 Tax=Poecilia reticulata TaxID=8081 RepID=A0A3P9QHH9_POERE